MIDQNPDSNKKEELTLKSLEKDKLMNTTVEANATTHGCFKRILFFKF